MSQPTETTTILDQFLHKSVEYLSSAEAFLKAEVPAFIQELLSWAFYESLFWFLGLITISIIFLICHVIATKQNNKHFEANRGHYDSDISTWQGWSMALCIFFFLISLANLHTMIKVKVAPRVYLLQEVKALTKQ